MLLSADRYRSAGKDVDIIPKLAEIAASLKVGGLQHIVLVGHLNKDRKPKASLRVIGGVNVMAYPDLLDPHTFEIKFWRGPSNAPLWVLYSSGTSEFFSQPILGVFPLIGTAASWQA